MDLLYKAERGNQLVENEETRTDYTKLSGAKAKAKLYPEYGEKF